MLNLFEILTLTFDILITTNSNRKVFFWGNGVYILIRLFYMPIDANTILLVPSAAVNACSIVIPFVSAFFMKNVPYWCFDWNW